MKINLLLIAALLLCFLNHLPFPWATESVQRFVAQYAFIFQFLGIILFILCLRIKKAKTVIAIIGLSIILTLLLTDVLQDMNYRFIMTFNRHKRPEAFTSPVLGIYKVDQSTTDAGKRKYYISFISTHFLHSDEALIYDPGHGWGKSAVAESEYFKKYYDKNWYWGILFD